MVRGLFLYGEIVGGMRWGEGVRYHENAIIQEYHKALLQNAGELCERYRKKGALKR